MAEQDTRPRVIILKQGFDPEPAFKGLKFAKALQERGFDVRVVTAFPNYPGGKIYDGYKVRPLQHESMDGVSVTRLAIYPSHDRSAIRRAATYLSFCLSSFVYLLFGAPKSDIVYVYHPPLTVALAAVLAKFFRRTPIVLDVQDLWPDTLSATGMVDEGFVLKCVRGLCNFVYRRVDEVVVLSPGFRTRLIERGVPDEKLHVIYNWADETPPPPALGQSALPASRDDAFKVLFAGNMGPAQALDSVLDAARLTSAKHPRILYYFLGSGVEAERLKQRATREKLENIIFLPRVPLSEVGGYLAAADCLLVHLRDDPLFSITIPSKTQSYMAAGKPIIMAVRGDAAHLVEQAGGGLVVEPEQAEALAAAIQKLSESSDDELAAMAEANRQFYHDNLSMAQGANRFTAVFQKVLATRASSATNYGRGFLKRFLDVFVSIVGLAIVAIPMLAIAIGIRATMGSPVFFRQTRPGKFGQPFTMYKFRTMREAQDASGKRLPSFERITPLGRFLRSTSLDELPELFNVLAGHMSLVGPRPLLVEYLPLYTKEQMRRHDVRPGLTGLAQVNGRNAISWEEKFRWDVDYVETASLWLDIKILAKTIMLVFRRTGVNQGAELTMPRFKGSSRHGEK